MSDTPDTVLWALVVSAYHLEKVDPKLPTEIAEIRKLLSLYSAETVSTYFLKAEITFARPRTLASAQALYEHYGVDPTGLEKMYERKPQ